MNTLLLKLVVTFALFQYVLCIAKGLSANVTTLCKPSCTWNTPEIWSDGIVPLPEDTVDIQISGTYTIQVTGNVTVTDFHIGIDDGLRNSGTQTFEVTSGSYFASTSSFHGLITSVVQVDVNASFVVTNAGETQGFFILYGFASFGGSNPSLEIDTKNAQNPVNILNGKLEMYEGSVLVATNGVTISGTSDLNGSGTINGSLNAHGNIRPGMGNVGTLHIGGDWVSASTTEIYIDVASSTSFDKILITGQMHQDGDLFVNTINKYSPLSHSDYRVFTYNGQRNGFDKVSADCTVTCLPGQNKWDIRVDQSYSDLLYDSASALLISFATISFCVLFTLL